MTQHRILQAAACAALWSLAGCGSSTSPAGNPGGPQPPTEIPLAPTGVWLYGDTHVHSDHSSDGSLPRQIGDDRAPGNVSITDQIDQARLVGLDFLSLTDHRTYDQHYDPLWESDRLLLTPGEEANGSPHATVQGGIETIVQGAQPEGLPNFVALQQSIWDAHAQGAVWIHAHPDDGHFDDGQPNERASAQGYDLVEAWNRASDTETEIDYAENRWNAGFRFGLVGASDSHFRELWLYGGPGQPRTGIFAPQTDGQTSERGLLGAMRAGRTLITPSLLAPQLALEADLQGDGIFEAVGGDEVIAAPGTRGTLRLRVQRGIGTRVLLYRAPGRSAGAWQSFTPTQNEQSFLIPFEAGEQPMWYRAEARGVGLPASLNTEDLLGGLLGSLLQLPDQLRALSAPLFVSTAPVEAQPEIPLPADTGRADGATLALGAAGRFAGFPDLALADGRLHLVAETHEIAATRVLYRQRRADGSWTAQLDLAPQSASARFPKIAARGSEVWAVWQDERAGQVPRRPAIYLRRSSDGGLSWQPEQLLRGIPGRAERPDIVLRADGRPVVAWQEIRSGQAFDIFAQVVGVEAEPVNVSGAGKQVQAANLLDSRSARYPASVWPSLAVAPDGRIALGWQDNRSDSEPLWTGQTGSGEGTDPDNWQIQLSLRDAAGDAWSTPASLGADDRADRHPALAFDKDNRLVVAWDSKELRSSGANLAVLAAVSADGLNFSEPATIAEAPAAMSQYPRLGRDGTGKVQAVWYDSRAADWRWRVMRARLNGDSWQDATLIPSRGINTWPAIDGGAVAFASTRNAQRMQRDATQQIHVLMP